MSSAAMTKKKKAAPARTMNKTLGKVFTGVKILLAAYPFIVFFYLQFVARQSGTDLTHLMQQSPIVNVAFLTAMLQPFAAWLVVIAERRVKAGQDNAAMISVLLIFIAEAMMRNMIGLIAVGLLFFYIYRKLPVSFKQSFSEPDKSVVLRDATGALVLIAFAALCLFAATRLGAVTF